MSWSAGSQPHVSGLLDYAVRKAVLQHSLYSVWHLHLSAHEHPAAALAHLGAWDLWQHVLCSLWRLPGELLAIIGPWSMCFVHMDSPILFLAYRSWLWGYVARWSIAVHAEAFATLADMAPGLPAVLGG